MPATIGTLEALAQQVGTALQPLETLLDQNNLLPLFSALGLTFPPELLQQAAFVTSLQAGASAAGNLASLAAQLSTAIEQGQDGQIVSIALSVTEQIPKVITALSQIGTELGNLSASLPGMNAVEVKAFADNLAESILSYLLLSYLYSAKPGLVGVGNLLGILDYIPTPGVAGDSTHPAYMSRQFNLSNLGSVLTTPMKLFQTLFDWGNLTFDGSRLFPRLSATFSVLGMSSANVKVGNSPFLDATFVAFKANPATHPPQLCATSKYAFKNGQNITIPLNSTWKATVQIHGAFTAGLQATIAPPFIFNLFPPTGDLNGQFQVGLIAAGADAQHPLMLLGQTGGSRLQADSVSFGAGVTANWDAVAGSASAEPSIQMAVTGGKLFIDMSEADGFLSAVTSGTPIQANFAFAITWAPDTGIHITGGAQLQISLPLHLDLGPVTFDTIYLVAGLISNGLSLELSAALGVTLGPIQASVDRMGMLAKLTFPQQGGNLGPADLQIDFKPPNGLGISVDAGLVAGGGYISFDTTKGQYSGIFQLTLADFIQVTVIGVLDTKMPDGSNGFSFLLIITFGFPPIQLGFGFTLNNVGGLGGVNRTMAVDALQAGFRAHTLDSVLSPPDPIANSTQIISDIRSFFPVAQGRYLFGPLLELGWGTPTLITLTVGVLLEVPDPIRMAILGLIDAGLPTQDEALVELHIDILGVIDFGAKTFALDGSLFDSRVLIYTLSGDLAVRMSWGNNPNFLFSLGGFNPHFNTDGLNVPQLARLSVSLGNGDNPRLSANSYFALTSNSVQFGANVELYASAGGFGVHGYVGFDVLVIVSPFSFEFDFSAGFDVSYNGATFAGLNVDGTFSGPTPMHVHGDASITLLFVTVGASVDLKWGPTTQATIPSKPVLPDLVLAFQNPRSWSAALPNGATMAVSLITQKPDDKTLRVHPLGTLQVKETVVPLDLPITRYGNATPSDGTEFSIQQVQISGQTETIQSVPDYFAPGQFLDLKDADKLSKPSFEKHDAGVQIGSTAILNGQDSPQAVAYEEFQVDAPTSFSRFSRYYQMPADIHMALSSQGAGFASPLKNSGLAKYSPAPAPAAITVQDPEYVVASVEDLSIRSDILSGGQTTYYGAQAALKTYLSIHPEESMNLQILPLHEVAA